MLSDRKQLDMFGDGSPSQARPVDVRTRDSHPSDGPRAMDGHVDRLSGNSRPSGRTTATPGFDAFVDANPHVLSEMLKLARAKLTAGYKRIGAKALWEELREHLRVNKLGQWKLNNSYTALAARRLIEMEPALAGVIEVRKRKT